MTASGNCEKATVTNLGKMIIIRTEKGGKAIVGVHNLCSIAKRLGICLEDYRC